MNYKYLRHVWAAAKAGGVVRAGQQLNISPQTLSGQIKLLERSAGLQAVSQGGRGLELTDLGHLAVGYAHQIFALGTELETRIGKHSGIEQTQEFRVGLSDPCPSRSPIACWSRRWLPRPTSD